MASQDEATKLKLRALELKKAGDIAGAKAALAKARDLEFQDVTADQLTSPADLKRLAVTLKKRGDIAGAKAALVRAKQIEAGGGGGVSAAAQAAPSSSPEPEQRQQQEQRQRPPTEGQQLSARFPCLYNTASAGTVGSDGGDGGAAGPPSAAAGASKDGVKQQQQQQQPVQDAGAATDADDGPELDDSGDRQGWTDEEMMDEDTMTEMKAMGMADDVPSEQDYMERIQDSKRAALACKKGGDIAGAKRGLIKAKKLEAVMIKLYHDQDEDEDDDEDYSLLDELNDDGDADGEAFFEEMFGDDGNTLDLDDLDHLDAPMLKDMMESGMDVPDVDHVRRRAQEKKELAVALHKDGNAEGAKAALSESKRLQARADQLAEMLEAIESGALDEGDDMEALEAMLAAEDGGGGGAKPKASKQAAAAAATATAVPEEPMKSADEYKLDAVRLKKENKLSEAATALRMYKKALAKESSAAEAERRKEIVQDLRNEIALARDQEKLFAFYERFVDTHAGMAQLSFWKTYARDCAKAAKAVETRGSNAIDIMRTAKGGAMRIDDEDDLDFVGRCIDPSDMRLEVAILDVLSLSDNKHLKRELRASLKDQKSKNKKDEKSSDSSVEDMPSIRVDVTVQLPPSEKKPDDNISFTYEPTISEDGSYEFGPSHHADIPRGGRFFKTILRRMARKRIQITVYLVPPKKKGLFGKRPSTTETSLGTVVLELKDFLEANFVAGDFPLMDSLRRNELGGVVRLGVRTGVPYDPEAAEGFGLLSKDVDVQPYESMSFLSSSSGVGF